MSIRRAFISTAIIPFVLFGLILIISFWHKDMERARLNAEKLLIQNTRILQTSPSDDTRK